MYLLTGCDRKSALVMEFINLYVKVLSFFILLSCSAYNCSNYFHHPCFCSPVPVRWEQFWGRQVYH